MSAVWFEEIPRPSKIVRVVYHGDPDTADLDFVCTMTDEGNGVCEVKAAKGRLRLKVIAAIGLQAIRDGYRVLRIVRAKRGKALARVMRKVRRDGPHTVYEAQLTQEVRRQCEALV